MSADAVTGLDTAGPRVRVVTWGQSDGRLAAMISREDGSHITTVYSSRTTIEHRVRAAVLHWTRCLPAAIEWFEVQRLDGRAALGRLDGETVPVRAVDTAPSRSALADHLLWLAARVEAEGPSACSVEMQTDHDGGMSSTVRVTW